MSAQDANKTLSNNLIAGSFALIVVSLWSTVPLSDRLSGGAFVGAITCLIIGLALQVLSIFFGGKGISKSGEEYGLQALCGIIGIIFLAIPPLTVAFNGEKPNSFEKELLTITNKVELMSRSQAEALNELERKLTLSDENLSDQILDLRNHLDAVQSLPTQKNKTLPKD